MPNKSTVAIIRTGSPYFVSGGGASARGELDTDGFLRYLLTRDDLDVVFFGSIRGDYECLRDAGLHVIDIDEKWQGYGPGELTFLSDEALRERFDPYVQELAAMEPVCFVESAGPTPSWSWSENPNFASVYDFAIRWSAPPLYAMHMIQAPRYTVVTDPKCYKRDLEMSLMWPECIPRAVLSQEDRVFDKTIGGTPYKVHAAYAACEYWFTAWLHQWVNLEECFHQPDGHSGYQHDLHIAANAHLTENRLPKGRTDLWGDILRRCPPDETRVCGAGWDKHPLYEERPDMFVGVLKTFEEVLTHMASGRGSPMIPQWPGFNSTKIRLHAMMGSCPYPFGGEDYFHPMTYDRKERVLSLSHPARWIDGPPDLSSSQRCDTIHLVLEKTKPNFSKLDALVDRTIESRRAGVPIKFESDEWLSQFGGYVRCQ